MADSGADSVTPLNLAFTVKEFNMFVDDLLTGNSQPSVEEKPGGEAETSSTTNLMSVYLNLPHHLKSCLDYCYFVLHKPSWEKHRLGCLLLAEGLIKQDNSGSLMEDVASTVIDQLIGLGMLEKDYRSFNTVRIPSSYKKLGIGRVDTKSIFGKTPDSSIRLFITERGIEEDLYPNLSGLSVTSLFDLRYWYNNCKPRAYIETICKLKSLVVLDLKGDIECLPDEIGDLVYLKYLSLTYFRLVPHGSGRSLEKELEMVFCNMDELPVEELNIQQLWHLTMNTKTFNSKAGVPRKVGLRLNLHTLARFDAKGGIMSELIKFTQLRRLDVYWVSDEHVSELCAAIMNMPYLISLSMKADCGGFNLFPELESFSPPSRLQELELWGRLVDIPTWLLSMENLSCLALFYTYLHDESLFLLQFLPNLKYLYLIEAKAKQIGEEFCQAGGFPKLETLRIRSEILVEWTMIANGAFPSLRCLLFDYCPNLIVFPDGLQNINTLDELHLRNIHGDLERRLQGIENYRIKNIPKVQFLSD